MQNLQSVQSLGFTSPNGQQFSPVDISGITFWLPADAISGLSDGGAIGTWTDQSDEENNAIQSNADRKPLYKTNIVNGKPVVRFDGTDDFLTFPISMCSGFTAGEIFIVVRINTDPPVDQAQSGLYDFGFFNDAGGATHFPFTDGKIYDDFGSFSNRKTTVDPATDLSSGFHIYNVTSAANLWTSRLDGVQLFTTATNSVFFSSLPFLGKSHANDGDFFLDGDIAEAIMYSVALSIANRAKILDYLQNKYAL